MTPGAEDAANEARLSDAALNALAQRLLTDGLEGRPFDDLIATFGQGLNALGILVMRIQITSRTHHPVFGSIAHSWLRDDGAHLQHFLRRPEPTVNWLQSPLYWLLTQDADEMRQRLDVPDPEHDFPFFDDLRARGATDYVMFKRLFDYKDTGRPLDPNAPPEGCLVSFASDAKDGYSDDALRAIRWLLPTLLLSLKALSNRRMAEDIAVTYLGGDAGKRVLSGAIVRGSVEQVEAVIFYFDLSGFTRLSETLPGTDLVAMVNVYFEIVVDIVHAHGGNVLKFMGDGLLAIFDVNAIEDANRSALKATLALREEMARVNETRANAALARTGFTLALHRGTVLYGNIGGSTRLDFTVIGPAVNATARLSGMCVHVDQPILVSADVARPQLDAFPQLVSLGWYRLRGVSDRQELFTLD